MFINSPVTTSARRPVPSCRTDLHISSGTPEVRLPGLRATRLQRPFVVAAVAAVFASSVLAQGPGLAGILAEGWNALGTGDIAKASRAADRALADAPRSAAAVALAVEVEIAKGGPLSGLNVYERWLGGRRVDDAYALRRIAEAHLNSVVRAGKEPALAEALKALAADGDQQAAAQLSSAAATKGGQEAAIAASIGDRRAIDTLIERAQSPMPGRMAAIEALGGSGSSRAVAPLVTLLSDARQENRAAAAEALGKLGATDAIPRLKLLLNDPEQPVRFAAAGALYRLQDYSGVNMLDELMT